jgi:hypothetical protein
MDSILRIQLKRILNLSKMGLLEFKTNRRNFIRNHYFMITFNHIAISLFLRYTFL